MTFSRPRIEWIFTSRSARRCAAVVTVAALGCHGPDQEPTGVARTPIAKLAAKGSGGGGSSGSTSVTVTAANPASASQDTTLDVTVSGTGFATGAKATWSLNGDTTLVHVKSTKVVSASQLVATIVVPANAPVASYDVQVTLVGGKKGVGAELFTVDLADPTVTWKLPLNDAGLAFRSDHRFSDGTYSVYANGVCDVTTWVEMSSSDPFPGFGHVSLGRGSRACKRAFTLAFSDGQVETDMGNSVLRNLELIQAPITPGTTAKRTLAINIGGPSTTRCGRLLFGQGSQGAGVGSDSVLVSRSVDGASWHIQSNPGHTLALCENTNQLFTMPVDFVIVADDPSRFP